MSYTDLSMLENEKCLKIRKYLLELKPNMRSSITLSKLSKATNIKIDELGKYVDALVDDHILYPHFGLRCEECGMIYEDFENFEDINLDETYYCHYCNENKKISTNDIIVMFTFRNPNDFFLKGQCNNFNINVAALIVESEDNVNGATTICESIRELTTTMKKLHDQDAKERNEEKRKEIKNNKIKVGFKIGYTILAICVVVIIAICMPDIELCSVRIDIVIFVLSLIGDEILDYSLDKLL